jgi:hypothetical protein
MGGAAQVAMRVTSQIWQVVFASQTLQVFCLALRKKAQYVVVNVGLYPSCNIFITIILPKMVSTSTFMEFKKDDGTFFPSC